MTVALRSVDEPGDDWVPAKEAESITGRSRRTLNRLVDAGRVQRRRDKSGAWLYDRESLLRVSEVEGDPQTEMLDVARQFLDKMQEPMRLYLTHLETELKAMRARCEQLETLQVQLVKAREEALSESWKRETDAAVAEAEQARRNMIVAKGLQMLDGALSPAAKLVNSLRLEQLDVILAAGESVLDAEQLEAVRGLRNAKVATVTQTPQPAG